MKGPSGFFVLLASFMLAGPPHARRSFPAANTHRHGVRPVARPRSSPERISSRQSSDMLQAPGMNQCVGAAQPAQPS